MDSNSAITYRSVKFEKKITEYNGLEIFGPNLSSGLSKDWYYLGPKAVGPEDRHQEALIVKANSSSALCEVVDWEPVFIDIEGGKFSTWRGIPSNQEDYVAVGHFFVKGIEKPTHEDTAGIMAIRKDLVSEREPHHLIWREMLPFAILTLWDVQVSDRLHIPTGAFVSTHGDSSVGLQMGLLRFNGKKW